MQDNTGASRDPASPAQHAAPSQRTMTRRQVTRLGWIAALLVVVGGQLWLLLKLLWAPPAPGQGRGQYLLGLLTQFPPGSVTHFRKERVFLVHDAAGMLALADECTHQQCPLLYIAERRVLQCNCHGAQFTTQGEVMAGPAPYPLPRYAVTVQDGEVYVDTSKAIDRRAS